MRLIVCSTRDQQRQVQRENPEDKVVVLGDMIAGLQVSEIVDRTFKAVHKSPEWDEQWWQQAQCRVEPK